jgi:hypothetical protein
MIRKRDLFALPLRTTLGGRELAVRIAKIQSRARCAPPPSA